MAPRQFELASIFADANIAVDQNQMIMDILKRVAYEHDFACLLHEKPFAGINGSGKHNNFSLICNDGSNLFAPGKNHKEQLRFLLFISAFVKAIDSYPELLRMSVATPGNDHRLGANEAPPAIISVYLDEYLENIITEFLEDHDVSDMTLVHNYNIKGFKNLPADNSDRNRTSPVAFTGNKFEFRMLGSSCSAALPNIVINTIMAKALDESIAVLKKAKKKDLERSVVELIKKNFSQHKKILFSGDGYSDEWIKEAVKRGLPNIASTVEAISHYDDKKNADLLEDFGIFSESEIKARKTILFEQYSNTIAVEIRTLIKMANRIVLPSIAREILTYKDCDGNMLKKQYDRLVSCYENIASGIEKLEADLCKVIKEKDEGKLAKKMRELYAKELPEIRKYIDEYESISSKEALTIPTYSDILF